MEQHTCILEELWRVLDRRRGGKNERERETTDLPVTRE